MRFDEQAVHFGSPIGQAIDLMLAGNANDVLAARLGGIDVGIQNLFARRARFGQRLAAGIDNLAPPDEFEAPLGADAIYGDVVDGILERAGVDDARRGALGARRPVGWK